MSQTSLSFGLVVVERCSSLKFDLGMIYCMCILSKRFKLPYERRAEFDG